MKETMGCFAWVIVIVLVLILGPVLYYFGGWITGHILK